MELADILRRRKAVRSYHTDPVPREALERIVARGRKIPSAGHSQGLRLVVVTDEKTRQAIAQLGGEPYYVELGMEPWMSRAPAHIVVAVREDDYHERYGEADKLTDEGEEMVWPVPYWYVDAGAAVMLLWLAALDEGLGCGIFGTHDWDGLRALLGMPDDVQPVAVLTIGRPGRETVQGSAKRGWKPIDDVVRWERW
ncbi:MAG TPA: nitroreductase family protein [Gaiellaceae bacterium]|nr:nitroreductase family protein [Gaiellaceae bacterium]